LIELPGSRLFPVYEYLLTDCHALREDKPLAFDWNSILRILLSIACLDVKLSIAAK